MSMYERQKWKEHVEGLRWKQGEHVLILSPTSGGKTTLAAPLLEKRSHVVALIAKITDPTIKEQFRGWKRFREMPKGGFPKHEKRILLWPEHTQNMNATLDRQRAVFQHALNHILIEGNRCIYVDEGLFCTDPRFGGLAKELGMLHYYGRSQGISAITSSQRPSYLPRIMLSSITHGYIGRTYDKDDEKRLSEIGSIDPKILRDNLHNLEKRHDFVYVNPQGEATPRVINTRY